MIRRPSIVHDRLQPVPGYAADTPDSSHSREIALAMTPPTNDDLASIADRYRFDLNAQDVESFRAVIAGALASYDAVERLYTARLPEAPSRPYQWPAEADNELGAWYVTTELRTADDGPLAGRRVAIKDNIEVAGLPMMNGSATVEGFVPRRDATVITRVLDAGATITGKAVCEDLCFSGGSHTSKTGPVCNPWDRTKSAGGSSSGSAALVAAGQGDMALGGDQGGSVRIPSAFCGTVGHKPTYGLVPYTGAFPIENTLDHLGPITRTVRDAALMLGVLAGRDGLDPRQRADPPAGDYLAGLDAGVAGLRVGVVAEGFGLPDAAHRGLDDPGGRRQPGGEAGPLPGDDRQHGAPRRQRPPGDLRDGLPVGMMIVGRHFADAMCLRVAQAYEKAAGGFPSPPPPGG
jgi:amidase